MEYFQREGYNLNNNDKNQRTLCPDSFGIDKDAVEIKY